MSRKTLVTSYPFCTRTPTCVRSDTASSDSYDFTASWYESKTSEGYVLAVGVTNVTVMGDEVETIDYSGFNYGFDHWGSYYVPRGPMFEASAWGYVFGYGYELIEDNEYDTGGNGPGSGRILQESFPHHVTLPLDYSPTKLLHAATAPNQITTIGVGNSSQPFTASAAVKNPLASFGTLATTPSAAKTSGNGNYATPSQIHATYFADYARWRHQTTLNQDLDDAVELLAQLQYAVDHPPACTGDTCFTGETLVLMADGTMKRIDAVEIGDSVLAVRDDSPHMTPAAHTVSYVYRNDAAPTWKLVFSDESETKKLELEATAEHPFYVEGKGWITVAETQPGDHCLTATGDFLELESKVFNSEIHPVFNLTVVQAHTYYVGVQIDLAVLVHNKDPRQRLTPQCPACREFEYVTKLLQI